MDAAGDEVIGVLECLRRERFDVLVLEGVEDVVATSSDAHELCQSQLPQVLGDGRGTGADMVGELVDRVLAVKERPDDPQPGRVSKKLEQRYGGIEFRRLRLPI